MKSIKHSSFKNRLFWSAFIPAVCVASCGILSPNEPFHLTLKLPESLGVGSPRYQRFLRKAGILEVLTEPGEKDEHSFKFPAGAWDDLIIPRENLRHQPREGLTLWARIWERPQEGGGQKTVLLEGKIKLRGNEKRAILPMVVKVNPGTFD